jgi:predicted alpha/beta-hydrolase family hydrolase
LDDGRSTLYGPVVVSNYEPPGYDDWFDDPEPPTLESGRGNRPSYDIPHETEEDVWTLPEDEQRLPRRRGAGGNMVIGGHSLTSTQVAILAIAALAVFVAILAAAGVFSSTPAATTQTPPPPKTNHTTTTTKTTPTITVPTGTTLQLNSTDTAAVKKLQKALIALGYLHGKADGAFGAGTQTAVEDFQSANGLTVDGVAGHDTLVQLNQQLNR